MTAAVPAPAVPAVDVPARVAELLAAADRDLAAAESCERAACQRNLVRARTLLRAACALRERAQLWRAMARSYERAVELGIEASACLAAEDARAAADLDRIIAAAMPGRAFD